MQSTPKSPPQKGKVNFEATQCHYQQRKVLPSQHMKSMSFNGDLGYISDLIPGKATGTKQDVVIDFDGNEVIYSRTQWLKFDPTLPPE